ncbi:hypothetical protein [Dankookia sp. P2]
MSVIATPATRPIDPLKFRDPLVTAKGSRGRASRFRRCGRFG